MTVSAWTGTVKSGDGRPTVGQTSSSFRLRIYMPSHIVACDVNKHSNQIKYRFRQKGHNWE